MSRGQRSSNLFLHWVKNSHVNRVWLLLSQLCCEESSGKYFKHVPNAVFKSHCSASAPARLPLPGFLMCPFPRWHSWIKPPLAAVTGQLSNPHLCRCLHSEWSSPCRTLISLDGFDGAFLISLFPVRPGASPVQTFICCGVPAAFKPPCCNPKGEKHRLELWKLPESSLTKSLANTAGILRQFPSNNQTGLCSWKHWPRFQAAIQMRGTTDVALTDFV